MLSRNLSEVHKKGLHFMSDLYERIDRLCKNRNINITTMCKESGASRASLSDLKAGRKQKLSADTLSKIAVFFNVSVDFLLGNDDDNRALEKARLELDTFTASNPMSVSGERLEMLFNASGYDHVVVCFNLGIEQYYLDNWMDRNDLPPKPIIDKILGVFFLKPEDLLSDKELLDYYNEVPEWGVNKKAPTAIGERHDVLDEVDVAFYGEFKELDEDQKATIRDMVAVMRQRKEKRPK